MRSIIGRDDGAWQSLTCRPIQRASQSEKMLPCHQSSVPFSSANDVCTGRCRRIRPISSAESPPACAAPASIPCRRSSVMSSSHGASRAPSAFSVDRLPDRSPVGRSHSSRRTGRPMASLTLRSEANSWRKAWFPGLKVSMG